MSTKCHHCLKVKRCRMYTDRDGHPIYLCLTDARELGYRDEKMSCDGEAMAYGSLGGLAR